MKRAIAALLGLALAASTALAYGRGGNGGGGHGGGGRAGAAASGRPAMSGGFTHFTTGPMRFTTGPQGWRPPGVRPPGVIGHPPPIPPRPISPIHNHPGFVGGGTVIVTGPVWYPVYPYPYPYVTPVYGGSAYNGAPTYSDVPPEADAQGYTERNDYWYYCPDSQTYYPYVSTCPSPWVKVLPEPSDSPPN